MTAHDSSFSPFRFGMGWTTPRPSRRRHDFMIMSRDPADDVGARRPCCPSCR